MRGSRIEIGENTITGRSILSGNCFIGNSLAGEELSIDALDARIDCATAVPTLFAPSDADGMLTVENELFGVRPIIRFLVHDLTRYAYGEAVRYYHNDALIGKFYMSSVKRVGKYDYEISCTSAIGLLDNDLHYGGLYSGEGMGVILADIVGGAAEYLVDAEFVDAPVYGWLPVATRRENLHQLLFAMGASLRKNTAGVIHITAMSDANPLPLPSNRLMLGGSVDYRTPATVANISEHAYAAYDQDETVTLFEGEVSEESLVTPTGRQVSGTLVLFDWPIHDLAVENGSILEQGVNYAVLEQSAKCLLTGKKYTHTMRVITAQKGEMRDLATVKDAVVTVDGATLVSLANSENVAQRVLAYYGSASTIESGLLVGAERPGDPVMFSNPFGEETRGFIRSMDLTMSGTLTAATNFVSGYVPTGIGNYYQNYALFTTNGTFVVPADSQKKIRAILIGGGQGGGSGGNGDDGEGTGFTLNKGKGGQGGDGGSGGEGGNILVVTLAAVAGQQFGVKIGLGGSGGATDEAGQTTPGSRGSVTTFGAYSSADGTPSETGYINLMNGAKYALPGEVGLAGGKGSGADGTGPSISFGSSTYRPGADGETVTNKGATGGGGFGGGAAAGANGAPGSDGDAYRQPNGSMWGNGGVGGVGAAAPSRAKAGSYGAGGPGGHGGGGGGGQGGASSPDGANYAWGGEGGKGGAGGRGGNGSNGCVIIYY